jgi:exodeoxyribonuclease VII small subunit
VSQSQPSLEARIAAVEAIVARLESDRLELDEALALFEEGVGQLREVERILKDAEVRVERLVAEADGSVRSEPAGGSGDGA